jgi:high-affinity iron transporter
VPFGMTEGNLRADVPVLCSPKSVDSLLANNHNANHSHYDWSIEGLPTMFATAVIVFRETLEAALIVSIVLAATRGVAGRRRWIGGGIVAGVAGALVIAALTEVIAGALQGIGQELFNASILIAAVAMLAWHHLWMAVHGRALASRLRRLSDSVREGGATLAALSIAVALAVLREGAETVLFIQGIATSEPLRNVLAGLALGLTGGAALGALLYLGLVHVPVKHFFKVTGWMIVALAAGLAAQAARFLEQASVLPPIVPELWDTSSILSEASLPGQLLHVLVGYTSTPSGLQFACYVATAVGLIAASRWRSIAATRRPPQAQAT